MRTFLPKSVIKSVNKNNDYLKQTLKGARYPLAKSRMIEVAELNFADGDILDVLYALGDSNYYCLADVQEEIHYLLHNDRIKLNENLMFEYGYDGYDDEDEDEGDDDKNNSSEDTNITDDKIDRFMLTYL
jgi:hypothetical protein